MSKFEHSFQKVYEALLTRYTAGCFSAGDVVKFDTKAIQKSEAYKSLSKALKTRLDDMMRTSDAGETVIVVTDVCLGYDNPKAHTPATMTIAYSHGGGRWVEPITIPGSLAEFMYAVEPGANLVDKIPATSKIEYPVSTEAEEVDLKELEKNRTKGHASSTLHGESYERDENGTGQHKFQVGERYKADYNKNDIFEVIKREETHITLKPITLNPDSPEDIVYHKPIKRKIEKSYMPQRREYCESAKISARAGYIYADSPFLVYADSPYLGKL